MLSSRDHPTQIQKWYNRLMPLIAGAREQLCLIPPDRLARSSGCTLAADGTLRMTLQGRNYAIRPPAFTIAHADGDAAYAEDAPSEFTQALILTYLVTADGTPPSGRWIAYHDLPGGMFYAQAFRGYAETRLARELGTEGLDAFCRGAERIGGQPIEIGNAGYAFQVLPRVRLGAVYWLGDEDFPSSASILFEDTGPHYMSTDGLAVLGSHLVNALLQAAGA
jgi:hypothetical protein